MHNRWYAHNMTTWSINQDHQNHIKKNYIGHTANKNADHYVIHLDLIRKKKQISID